MRENFGAYARVGGHDRRRKKRSTTKAYNLKKNTILFDGPGVRPGVQKKKGEGQHDFPNHWRKKK